MVGWGEVVPLQVSWNSTRRLTQRTRAVDLIHLRTGLMLIVDEGRNLSSLPSDPCPCPYPCPLSVSGALIQLWTASILCPSSPAWSSRKTSGDCDGAGDTKKTILPNPWSKFASSPLLLAPHSWRYSESCRPTETDARWKADYCSLRPLASVSAYSPSLGAIVAPQLKTTPIPSVRREVLGRSPSVGWVAEDDITGGASSSIRRFSCWSSTIDSMYSRCACACPSRNAVLRRSR